MATLEQIIAPIRAKQKQYMPEKKRPVVPAKRFWLVDREKGNKINIFPVLFEEFARLYHMRITGEQNFKLKVNEKYRGKLKFLYKFLTQPENAKGLYLEGNYGTGKTMTAWVLAEIIKYFIPSFKYSLMTANQIIDFYKMTADTNDWKSYNDFRTKDLIIIDDLGSESNDFISVWGNKTRPIHELLEYRYKTGRWTWVTTNYDLEQLADKYSGYIIDRLQQMMYFVKFNWESHRH